MMPSAKCFFFVECEIRGIMSETSGAMSCFGSTGDERVLFTSVECNGKH